MHFGSLPQVINCSGRMFMIVVSCKGCGKEYKLSADKAGKYGKCKKCGSIIHVPDQPVLAADKDREEVPFNLAISDVVPSADEYEILGRWRGEKSQQTASFNVDRPWHINSLIEGEFLSFFAVTVETKRRRDTLSRPINEHHIDGRKKIEKDIFETGKDLFLDITTGGPSSVKWFIIVYTAKEQ